MSVTKVVLAKLSPTMEEGTIVKWSLKEGDAVKPGDVLAEIETDKANMEMESLGTGVLRRILVPAGGKAPVGALIGVIADPDEDIGALVASTAPPPTATAPAPSSEASPAAAAPVVAPPAAAAVLPPPAPAAIAAGAPDGGRVKASPIARAIAAKRSIPIESIPGSGPGGRVIKRDVEAWQGRSGVVSTAPAQELRLPPAAPAPDAVPGHEIPLSNMRRTIARRLSESKFSAPHFYVTVDVDMDAAVSLREQLERAGAAKVSYNDLIVKACGLALRVVPGVNASWGGDKIVSHGEVHVGIAVSVPDGLITPVVRNADRKSVAEIAREAKDLAARARDRKLRPDEYAGSTFTTSNLGMYDVTEFTAIINPPDSAILAIGAVQRVPVVVGDGVRPGHRMKLTLSADHRVVDGALAAQFLKELRRLLENPIALFL